MSPWPLLPPTRNGAGWWQALPLAIVLSPLVIVNGAPEDIRNSAPNCHCPTRFCTQPGAP